MTPWSQIPITFTAADIRSQHYPHNDPLVIRRTSARTRSITSVTTSGEYWWTMAAQRIF
jgi:hypothetical protein